MPDIQVIFADARAGYRIVSPEVWEAVVLASQSLRSVEAALDHKIEVRSLGEERLAREISDKGEIILRLFPSEFALDAFLKRRIDIYERMWDGCGCKVDYYD
ncbi:hypothetical protein H8E52_06980 [bacterium]|nr:hypothetical protein [bacterium]